jgi:hypothetical protein
MVMESEGEPTQGGGTAAGQGTIPTYKRAMGKAWKAREHPAESRDHNLAKTTGTPNFSTIS